jgi:hypothetical protein
MRQQIGHREWPDDLEPVAIQRDGQRTPTRRLVYQSARAACG